MTPTQIRSVSKLSSLVAGIRTVVDAHADWASTAQLTRIHDHVTWCAFGVIQGVEHEELFDADLKPLGRSANHVGDVSGFAPPGDIHRVRNTGETTAISIHVYGTDVTRVGSSARRYYD